MTFFSEKILPILLDVQSGLTAAKNEIMDTVKLGVNSIAIPIICAVLAGVLIFAIASAVKLHRNGEDYSNKITTIVVVVIIIAVVASSPAWIWQVVGV